VLLDHHEQTLNDKAELLDGLCPVNRFRDARFREILIEFLEQSLQRSCSSGLSGKKSEFLLNPQAVPNP